MLFAMAAFLVGWNLPAPLEMPVINGIAQFRKRKPHPHFCGHASHFILNFIRLRQPRIVLRLRIPKIMISRTSTPYGMKLKSSLPCWQRHFHEACTLPVQDPSLRDLKARDHSPQAPSPLARKHFPKGEVLPCYGH